MLAIVSLSTQRVEVLLSEQAMMDRVEIPGFEHRYRVVVRKPIPNTLCDRISALHAQAILKGGDQVAILLEEQTYDDNEAVQGGRQYVRKGR